MRLNLSRNITLLMALTVAAALAGGYRCRNFFRLHSVHAAGNLTPQPIQFPGFPVAASTINGWVSVGNQSAIRTHGWNIWAGLSAITSASQGLPIYETWYSNTEVQQGPPVQAAATRFTVLRSAGHPIHNFQVPEQLHHARLHTAGLAFVPAAAAPVDVHAQILVTTQFDADYAQSVWSNTYQNPATVWNLQANWGTITPVSARVIKPFAAPSISTKPVYQFVNGPRHNNGLTTVKYWLGDLTTGPTHSTNRAFPTPDTWNQCVVVNTGSAPNPGNLTCFGTSTPASGMVPVSKFYNYVLTAAEATNACAQLGLPSPCAIQAGDYAILVAMHVSTRENDNWTWQTFWFNYNQPFPYGAPPANVSAPFNSYAMCSGYSMTTRPPNSPRGTNTECYNPYLETGLGPTVLGTKSNCMSCHMVASIGNNPNDGKAQPSSRNSFGYPTFAAGTANISVSNPSDDKVFFDCQTTTDFSWFLANYVAGQTPNNQAPCVLTSLPKPPLRKN
jgi:hypothetical protein